MNTACYGNPISLSTSAACRACPAVAGCIVHARDALDQLPTNDDVSRARQALGKVVVMLTPTPPLSDLPERVAGPANLLRRKGWFTFARDEIAAGRNPATKGWKRVLCQALINGRATRPALLLAFQTELGMKASSAEVALSAGLAIFAAGGLVKVDGSRVIVSAN